MSAHTNGVPTLSQLAESGLITTWQTRPPPRTKGRCHFINLLWPHQRVNSPSKTGKKREEKKLVTIAGTSLEPQFVFSPAIFCSLPLWDVSSYLRRRRRLVRFLTEEWGTKKEEWKHNQRWWFHWLFIIRWGWGLAGHYLIIHLERIVKFSLLQDFIRLHIVVFSPSFTTATTTITITTLVSLGSSSSVTLQLTVSSPSGPFGLFCISHCTAALCLADVPLKQYVD